MNRYYCKRYSGSQSYTNVQTTQTHGLVPITHKLGRWVSEETLNTSNVTPSHTNPHTSQQNGAVLRSSSKSSCANNLSVTIATSCDSVQNNSLDGKSKVQFMSRLWREHHARYMTDGWYTSTDTGASFCGSNGWLTLPDTDSVTESDLDSKPDGYIILCRKCSHYTDSDPYIDFDPQSRLYPFLAWLYRIGIRVCVRHCK